MDPRDLWVRPHDEVLPAWRKLLRAIKSLRILPGRGVLLTRTSTGVIINARASVEGFVGSWSTTISGFNAGIRLGLVNGIEPYIGKLPMSGTDSEPAPLLELKPDRFDSLGCSWIAIRLEIDPETGRMIALEGEPPKLTMVQTDVRISPDDLVGLKPVALLKRPKSDGRSLGVLHQVSYFDFTHRTAKQNGRWRHFFDPA